MSSCVTVRQSLGADLLPDQRLHPLDALYLDHRHRAPVYCHPARWRRRTTTSTLGAVTSPVSRVLSSRSSTRSPSTARSGPRRSARCSSRSATRRYPFIAIREGEATILDADGHEIVRHGASGFLGEMNLLSGQTVFLTAVVTEPMRYIAVDRETLRGLLFEDGALSDLLLSAFVQRRELLQQPRGRRDRDHRPGADPRDPRAGRVRAPPAPPPLLARPRRGRRGGEADRGAGAEQIPLVRLPGGDHLHRPSNGELSRALGIGLELAPREEVDLLIVGGGPAGLGAAVYGASEGLDTLVVESNVLGGQAGDLAADRELPRLPGRDQRHRTDQPRDRPGAQVHRPHRDPLPGALARTGRRGRPHREARGRRTRWRPRRCCSRPAPNTANCRSTTSSDYEGLSVFYAAGPPEAQLCGAQRVGVVGGGNSAAQAAVWLARGGALVTLLHRRADLSETMSDYLIDELERYGVAVRDRSEIGELHGDRRPPRSGHADRRHRAAALLPLPLPRRRRPAPTGSATASPATRRASSSPARTPAPRACSRRASPASTRPATSAPARSSAARPRSARAPPSSASSTST